MNQAQTYFRNSLDQGNVKQFNKFGEFVVTKAVAGQKIDTVINGVTETTNTAKDGDNIVTGISGETYLIDDKKLQSRYAFVAKTAEGDLYRATGHCFAVEYQGTSFTFTAPWGEDMICDPGDFIASTSKEGLDDVYRIEKGAFANTYKKAVSDGE
jgi:hypothetical protein